MKKTLLPLFIIASFSNIYAQNTAIKEVLSSYKNDIRLEYNNQLTNFAKGLKYDMPLLKQVEARIGINGSTLGDSLYGGIRNEDLYGLNISTNSFKEIKLQKQVKQAQIDALASENRVFEQQALLERYQAVASIYFNQKLRGEKQKLDSLLHKKHGILRTMIERGIEIKVKEVMDTEGDKNAVELALLDVESSLKFQKSKLKLFVKGENFSADLDFIDFTDFISIKNIQQIIDNQLVINSNPVLDYKNGRTALASTQLNFIAAQNRQIFNSLRLGYQNPVYLEEPKKLNPFNNFSVRVGLVVPLPGNNNYKRSDAMLELREAQNETALTRELFKKNIHIQYFKLNSLLEQHRLSQVKIEQSLINKMLGNEKLLAQMTPLEIADLSIEQQKIKVRTLEIETEITSEYIKMLDFNGSLSVKPLKNYLSVNLETF